MSTDLPLRSRSQSRGAARFARSRRRYVTVLVSVLVALVVFAGAGAALSLGQGPRVSHVSADMARAVLSSGSRVVITTNQALTPIDASQVSVSPSVPFTVDASGRTIGVRFTQPLVEGTTYTVTVEGARSAGGGATASLVAAVEAPSRPLYTLRRAATGDDMILRADLSGTEAAAPDVVFTHEHIEDYRATVDGMLVVSVVENDIAALLTVDPETGTETPLAVPGPGQITSLEVSDRGNLVGYVFSDMGIAGGGKNASILYLSSLSRPESEPRAFAVAGEVQSISQWHFVPNTSSIVVLPFSGDVLLQDPSTDADPVLLGTALAIEGMGRDDYSVFLKEATGFTRLNLQTAERSVLEPPAIELAAGETVGVESITPLAGTDLLWTLTHRNEMGIPVADEMVVQTETTTRSLGSFSAGGEVLLDVCATPAADRLAITVETDAANVSYDGYVQPLPVTVRTRVIDVASGDELGSVPGFDASWCGAGPWRFW